MAGIGLEAGLPCSGTNVSRKGEAGCGESRPFNALASLEDAAFSPGDLVKVEKCSYTLLVYTNAVAGLMERRLSLRDVLVS